MKQETVEHLIDLCVGGQKQAFSQIVSEYQQLVFLVSFRLLCDEENAKDAVQETFIKVWQNISKYDKSKPFLTWLYTIAVNCCYDKLRQRKLFRVDEDRIKYLLAPADIEKDFENKDLATVIVTLTDDLTATQKVVFVLRYLEELDVEEIEEITKLSPKQIKDHLYLARKYIKRRLNDLDIIN